MSITTLIAALICTLLSLLLGLVWFKFIFGKKRANALGFEKHDIGLANPNMARIQLLLLSAISALVFGAFIDPEMSLLMATSVGFAVGAGWIVTSLAVVKIVERQKMELFWINASFFTLQFTMFGMVFGVANNL